MRIRLISSEQPSFMRLNAMCLFVIAVIALTTNTWSQEDPEDDPAAQAVALFNKGQDAHEKGELTLAVENYEKAIKIIPDFPEAELQRGNAYLSLGRIDDAEKAFRRAVELREDWSLALANLGSVLVRKTNFVEAERYLNKAIELDDLNFPAYVSLTELRLRTKAPPEILKALLSRISVLTQKASPTASIWAARAAIEIAIGDQKSAKSSLANALQIDPNNVFALTEISNLALLQNDPTAADVSVKSLEALAPKSESTRTLRARVLFAQGKADDALSLLKSIQDPAPETVRLIGDISATTITDPAELEKQLEANPKSGLVLSKLCSAYRTGDPAKALDYCRRASEAAPESLPPVIGYAAALVQAQQYENAVIVLRRILALAPDNATAHANLATALFQLKRFPEAKVEFQWLTQRQPQQAIAFYFLGIVHDRLAEYMDAAANYQQFLRLADAESSKLEIEKVNLRLPAVLNLIKEGKGKKRGR